MERRCTSHREGVLFTSRGGTIHVERGYYSRREGVLFTSRGGTIHVERGYYSNQEGVLFTSRGGALHVERGCTSRREGVLFTLRGGALHVERGYYSRREGVRFTSREGGASSLEGAWQHIACDLACTCNIANVGVVEGVAFVAVKITLNEFLGNEKSSYRFEKLPRWKKNTLGYVVDAFTISLELVYRDLIAGEQLNLFAVNVKW